MDRAILVIGLLVFFGHLLAALFRRTRVPDVLVLMVVGILLGPHVLNWTRPSDFGKIGPVLTTVALLVILFESGMNLPLGTLWRSLAPTGALTLATAGICTALGTAILAPRLADWRLALLAGIVVSAVSSAVVIPLLRGLKLGETVRTVLTLESVLTDVVAVICTFALVAAIQSDRFHLGHLALHLTYALLAAVALGATGGVAWRAVLIPVHRFPHSLFAEFAFVFVLYGLAEMAHASGPVAALVFGITASNLSPRALAGVPGLSRVALGEFSPAHYDFFGEVVFLTKLFFFVYLGMSLTLSDPRVPGPALLIVGGTYLARLLICRLLLTRRATRREAGIAAVMVPKGLTSAVLASVPAQAGVPGGALIQEVVFAVVFLSITLTSVLLPLMELAPGRRALALIFRPFVPDPAPAPPHAPAA